MKKIISLIVCVLLLTGCGGSNYKTITENEVNEFEIFTIF